MRAARLLATLLVALAPIGAWAGLPVELAQVVRTYPHDTTAFTEGLLIRDGWLYESTGYEGRSFIRKRELATERIAQSVQLPPDLFGEGIVDWKDKLYSVTWHGGTGFVWSLDGFRKLGSWHYTGEGWAMTQDGKSIILSDGTPVLRFLDPKTLKVVRTLKVTAEGVPIERLNELEYVHGEILANIWMTNGIVRIDPKTGHVKGWIDVSGLSAQIGTSNPDAVPNGIAYDKATDRLYVTGKDWPLLFEIKLPRGS
jgi:glutamine cyclotransferase